MEAKRKLRVAINGFGRIGKNVLRAILNRARDDIEVVAINELANIEEVVHLFVHDSTFGRFPGSMG
ncbi:MAG: glyceraldehyde 3-phosphate dehydrogenase NAD-binding domain-containing protein, partial [bacterium]|nr:glyceraldehyde 3-phosphate dehydrogenase NAD-binding domain-containing protein [bacterium]